MIFETASRRDVLKGLLLAGTAIALIGAVGLPSVPALAAEQTKYPMDEMMAPSALPDVVQGKADAPVTIVEYASMTCPHCAAFHATTWPTLKSKYLDAGKARFTLREFPLDQRAAAAFMLARCSGDKRNALVDLMFDKQEAWAFGPADKFVSTLSNFVKQTGLSQEAFDACLKDQKLYQDVNAVRTKGSDAYKVDATPTFFFNGVKQSGEISVTRLDEILAPLLKS